MCSGGIGVHHRRRAVVGDADLLDEDPSLEQKRAGSAEASLTSAWRVTAQKPAVAFHASGVVGSQLVERRVEVSGVRCGVEQRVGERFVCAGHGSGTYRAGSQSAEGPACVA